MARGTRVSIFRSSKIHGPGVRQLREWPIIQRALDGRTWMPVRDGDRVESTTSTAILADAVVACVNDPATRLLNVADADPQPARRLASLVAQAAGANLQQVEVDATCPSPIGLLPWNQDNILDTSALNQLGVQPATFADTIQQEVGWVTGIAAGGRDGAWQLPPWLQAEPLTMSPRSNAAPHRNQLQPGAPGTVHSAPQDARPSADPVCADRRRSGLRSSANAATRVIERTSHFKHFVIRYGHGE